MSLRKYLELGEFLTIDSSDYNYTTKLLDFEDDETFVVYRPTYKRRNLIIEEGDNVQFFFHRPDGLFGFIASYLGTTIHDEIVVYRFKGESEVYRQQRRRAFRLPLTVKIGVLPRKIQLEDENAQFEEMTTVNISEEGILFCSPKAYMLGEVLIVDIEIPNFGDAIIEGRVVRNEEPLDRDEPYEVAINFDEMSGRLRKGLAQFIFKRQIDLRQRD